MAICKPLYFDVIKKKYGPFYNYRCDLIPSCVLLCPSLKPNDVAITAHFLHAMFSKFFGDLKIFYKILDLQSPIMSNASAESFLGGYKNTALAN